MLTNRATSQKASRWSNLGFTFEERQIEVSHYLCLSFRVISRNLAVPPLESGHQSLIYPQLKPGCLEFELLESSAMGDLDHVSSVIQECRELGVKFALDDFGIGYSTMTCLKKLPVAHLKIDQNFVHEMLDSPNDLAIVSSMVGLAGTFGIEVIAEGVETLEEGVALLELGCELAQGYAIARPMPAAELPLWVRNWQPHALWREVALS